MISVPLFSLCLVRLVPQSNDIAAMNIPRHFPVLLLLCVSVSLSFIPSSSPGEDLRWKLKEGEQLLAKVEQKSEVTSTIGGTSSVMTIETGMELLWSIAAVDEKGLATITQKFQRLRMKLEMPKA